MRVAPATVQLAFPDPALTDPVDRWWAMPESTRFRVLGLLAGLIARGVLVDAEDNTVLVVEVISADD
jgi:hypothetical protein